MPTRKRCVFSRERRTHEAGPRTNEESLRCYKQLGYYFWATIHKAEGHFIGRCGLLPQVIDDRQEAEVAHMIAQPFWGRGLGTEAARAIKKYGFQRFGFPRLISIIDPNNIASQRVAQRTGCSMSRTLTSRNIRASYTPSKGTPMTIDVTLCAEDDKLAFKNLFAFYRYDLMPFIENGAGSAVNRFGTINGETSRTHEEAFGDDGLWQKPGVIFPFLIRANGALAGLAVVVTQPHATAGRDYRMNEFFVLNKFRRRGSDARRPGTVEPVSRQNGRSGSCPQPRGDTFWKAVLQEHIGGNYTSVQIVDDPKEPGIPGQNFDNTEGKIPDERNASPPTGW